MSDDTTKPSIEEELAKLTPEQRLFHSQAMALAVGSSLFSGVNVRQYVLTGGKPIYAFLVRDLPEGPLVVCPMSVTVNPIEEKVSFLALVTAPVSKLSRSGIFLETLPVGLPFLLYLEAIEPLYKGCPGFFDPSRITKIEATKESLRKALKEAGVPTPMDMALDEKFTKLAKMVEQEIATAPQKQSDVGMDIEALDDAYGIKQPRQMRHRKH